MLNQDISELLMAALLLNCSTDKFNCFFALYCLRDIAGESYLYQKKKIRFPYRERETGALASNFCALTDEQNSKSRHLFSKT